MNSYQDIKSDTDYPRTPEILVNQPTLSHIVNKKQVVSTKASNTSREITFRESIHNSLQTTIATPDVEYQQRSTLRMEAQAPDSIVHELNWGDYEKHYCGTVFQDLKSTFVQLKSEKDKNILTYIRSKYEDIIKSAIDIGFIPTSSFKRMVGNKIETFVILSFDEHRRNNNWFPVFPKAGITDGVLTIIPTVGEHSGAFFAEQKDKIATYWSIFPKKTFAEVQHYCEEARLNNFLGIGITASVVENATHQVVGRVHLRPVVPPKVADVGYGVFPDYRGKGYATRALNIFTDWIFYEAGYMRIELGIKEGNQASERVAQACGYIRESVCPCRLKNNDGSFSTQISYAKISPFYAVKGEYTA